MISNAHTIHVNANPMQYDLLTDEGFAEYVESIDERLLATSEGRRALTEMDIAAFALIYLSHHLRGPQTQDRVTFADLHVALIEYGITLTIPPTAPRQNRDAFIAPRESGKSSWVYLILPIWAAAHGHKKFIAAFADTGPQALMHLATFKRELENNELLRQDFPDLCMPAVRDKGMTTFDTKKEYQAASGFVFMARGIDSGVLGMKLGAVRPDWIIGDDLEPTEANYSPYQAEQRLSTVIDGLFALNEFAHIALVGTVTMAESIMHALVRTVTQPNDEHPAWIQEQNIRVHYFAPIVDDEKTGERRSIWPYKWPLEYLESIMHTRAYLKNFLNDPMGKDGDYWNTEDFRYEWLDGCTKTLLSIDPFVKQKKTSDPCGLAVVSYMPKKQVRPGIFQLSKCMVEYADDCRLTGKELRKRVLKLLEEFPHIGLIVVEVNQGGDLWKETFHDMPVQVVVMENTVNKDVRAGQLHVLYQANRVVHGRRLPKAEAQMVSYPGLHDDIVDAVGNGVFRFIKPPGKKVVRTNSNTYV